MRLFLVLSYNADFCFDCSDCFSEKLLTIFNAGVSICAIGFAMGNKPKELLEGSDLAA